MAETEIRIENARSHNLKGVSCRIPMGALCVITGVSGSGKSSLAFDTLYAEGQRRYVTSLSTYARQFLERLPRPDVDFISNLPPAIAIEQRNSVQNARSTVGTASEILDHLRLLFAKLGETRCPDCKQPARPGGVSDVADRILERFEGERLQLATTLLAHPGEKTMRQRRDRLLREGYGRLLGSESEVIDVADLTLKALGGLWKSSLLLIDRQVPRGDEGRARLTEAIAAAFHQGDGRLVVVRADGERCEFLEGFACDGCGRRFATPVPALFSFNSPLGACETCTGFGRTAELDWDKVVVNPELSIEEDAIVPFATPMGRSMLDDLIEACEEHGIPVDVPFHALSEAQRELVFEGDEGDWYGVRGYFDWLDGRRYRVQARIQIARYRKFVTCTDCEGTRLCDAARQVWIGERNLGQLCRLPIAELQGWVEALEPTGEALARCGRLLELLKKRLATVNAVGIGYLALDRQLRTLSGGEAQRIQLSTALGGSLTSVLYVLDEPSIGLHPRDMERLLAVLRAIRDQRNTVVVVEHAPEIIAAADHLIDLGPGAGRSGGEIVAQGSVEEVKAGADSTTARALRGELRLAEARSRRLEPASKRLRILGARENNLRLDSLDIPLERLVAVTGVSGAGKSTLVHSVLVANLQAQLPDSAASSGRHERGACASIEGAEHLARVVVVEQSAVSRSPRSNPATVSKAFDGIRKAFASTREAKAAGVEPGWFSFNVAGGRCDACEGAGVVVIDMQFMDDVRVPCEACGGKRYRREVLELRYREHSIADVLALPIDAAAELFADHAGVVRALAPLSRVGLGYLSVGQPLSTLSGGEHQRLRLALALAEGAADTLYVLDEPTTGLHIADIQVLMSCLGELIEQGSSVVVVEHNLDVIRQADFVVDLGPEGGPGGGRVVVAGTPEEVAGFQGSHTGRALTGSLNSSL